MQLYQARVTLHQNGRRPVHGLVMIKVGGLVGCLKVRIITVSIQVQYSSSFPSSEHWLEPCLFGAVASTKFHLHGSAH